MKWARGAARDQRAAGGGEAADIIVTEVRKMFG